MITFVNHGPILVASNYWGSPEALAGKLILSPNAGAFRLLVAPSLESAIAEMQTGKEVLISRGTWPAMRLGDGFEILFDDRTSDPFALHLSPESFVTVPADSDIGKPWIFTAWISRRGKTRLALERPCWYRRVPSIPWLKPREADRP